jgi:exodeoxyribonuclease-5
MSVTLTAEQKDVVKKIAKNVKSGHEQVQTLGGYAGTGKTTITAMLNHIFPNFATCAFTGKAASVMRNKGMLNSQTIHRTIYYPVRGEDNKMEFWPKTIGMLGGIDGFLVDEASMVAKEEYTNLLSYGLPIVFIGDHGQLEPVGSDINVMKDPMYKLETIHRNAGEIAWFADHIRKGGDPWDFESKEKVQIAHASEATDDIILGTDQILCAFNNTRKGVNNNVRRLQKRGPTVEKGDRVICLRNNKVDGVFNGMQGTVYEVSLKKKKITIDMDDGERKNDLPFWPQQFDSETTLADVDYQINLFDFGYCITAHKSQGSEWDNMVVYEQICKKWDHTRWAYTAASRAKGNLIWLCQKKR